MTNWSNFDMDPISPLLGPPPYAVGPGVLAAMAARGDAPKSPEQYIGSTMSVTFGQQGQYWYNAYANETTFYPKG